MDAKDGETEAEVTTHLEYELSDYGNLLAKAMVNTRGQKALIKRLYSDRDEIVEHCSVDELRRAIWEPSLLSTLEGKKLAASFAPKIGIKKFWMLAKKIFVLPTTNKIHCQQYGEVFVLIWKQAARDPEKALLQDEIERELFMDLVFYGLRHEFSKKFLAAVNEYIRYNACCLFLPFYPFLTDNDFENAENVLNQQNIIMDLLKDDSYAIRGEACRRTLYILNTFWDSFSTDYIKRCLTQIVDHLAIDRVSTVRLAVYEGMRDLLNCSSAINACERALKCLFDKKGINDKNLSVRLAAFQLLNALKGHRFIKIWDILSMDSILKCFTVEDSSVVRAEIATLLLRSYKPPGTFFDEVVRRILIMGGCNVDAPPFFHYYLVNKKLISTEEAIEHIKYLTITVYKALRSFEGCEVADGDTSISNASEDGSSTAFVEPNGDDESEKAKKWRSTSLLLNCLVVMWYPLRADLMDQKYSKENEVLRKLLTKLFKYIFMRCKNTSILSAVMCLGKTLDAWRDAESIIFNELQHAKLTNDVAHMYLEVAASWDFLSVLEFIDSILENMKKMLSTEVALDKRGEKQKITAYTEFNRTIPYVKCIFKSSLMRHNLVQNNNIFVKKFYKSLCFVNQRILEIYFSNEAGFDDASEKIDSEIILQVVVLRFTMGCVLLTDDQENMEENESKEIIEYIMNDVNWVSNTLLPFLANELNSECKRFAVTLLEVFLFLWCQYVNGFDADDDFEVLVYKVLESICSDASLPFSSLIATINALKCLVVKSLSDKRFETVDKVIIDCARWVLDQCEEDDFDEKKCFNAWSSFIDVLQLSELFNPELKQNYLKIVVTDILEGLRTLNEEEMTIVNPSEIYFDPGPKVQFCVKKLLDEYPMQSLSLNIIDEMIDSLSTMSEQSDTEKKHSIGAIVQAVLLIHEGLPKNPSGQEKSIVRSIAEQCTSIMEALKKICIEEGFAEICSLCEELK